MLRVGRSVGRRVRRNIPRTDLEHLLMNGSGNHTQPVVERMDPVRPVACEERKTLTRPVASLATASTASRRRGTPSPPPEQVQVRFLLRNSTSIPERDPVVYGRRPIRVHKSSLGVDQPQTFIGGDGPDHLRHDVVDRADVELRPHVDVVA